MNQADSSDNFSCFRLLAPNDFVLCVIWIFVDILCPLSIAHRNIPMSILFLFSKGNICFDLLPVFLLPVSRQWHFPDLHTDGNSHSIADSDLSFAVPVRISSSLANQIFKSFRIIHSFDVVQGIGASSASFSCLRKSSIFPIPYS